MKSNYIPIFTIVLLIAVILFLVKSMPSSEGYQSYDFSDLKDMDPEKALKIANQRIATADAQRIQQQRQTSASAFQSITSSTPANSSQEVAESGAAVNDINQRIEDAKARAKREKEEAMAHLGTIHARLGPIRAWDVEQAHPDALAALLAVANLGKFKRLNYPPKFRPNPVIDVE